MKAKLIPLRKPEPLEVALSDTALVAACGAGDPDALGVLYDRYAQDVYRFLARLAYGEQHELEDLVQEVFLAAFRAAERFSGKSSVKTWVFGIAANIAKARARSSRRGRFARTNAALQVVAVSGASEVEIMAREAVARLERGLRDLDHDLRAAFVLCYLESVPGPEAARILAVPVGTLYRRLHQARAKLIACIDGAWP